MTFSKDQIKAEERRLHLCKELAGHFTGPYAPSKFVDFVPKVRRRVTPYVDFSKVPCGQGQETNMYEPFVRKIMKFLFVAVAHTMIWIGVTGGGD